MLTFSQTYAEIPLNTEDIPAPILNIREKKRSNPLTWKGQFSPQLVEALLREYASSTSTVFDPFVGSGTVLLEAGRLGLEAYGTEINPAAVLLAQTYRFINTPDQDRERLLRSMQRKLSNGLSDPSLVFQTIEAEEIEQSIKAALSGILENCPDRRECQLLETLVVLLDYWKTNLSHKVVFDKWAQLREHIQALPFSKKRVDVFQSDARQTPLGDKTADFVLTSPPYINVFNYHQQYRASIEALNWDVLTIAKSEIGSNRKHRSNRFLTAIQYCLDIAQVFKELLRVCDPDGRVVFVVGRESRIRGIPFQNGELVVEIATKALGYQLMMRQERHFTNRFGQKIYEDILHFSPAQFEVPDNYLNDARNIAANMLEAVASQAQDNVLETIKDAIANLETVPPSPIFNFTDILGKFGG